MSKLTDPGKGLPEQTATAQRMVAWKRPATKAARDKLRAERIQHWEVRHGSFVSAESSVT